jgi:hypothetical protein
MSDFSQPPASLLAITATPLQRLIMNTLNCDLIRNMSVDGGATNLQFGWSRTSAGWWESLGWRWDGCACACYKFEFGGWRVGGSECSLVISSPSSISPDLLAFWYLMMEKISADSHLPSNPGDRSQVASRMLPTEPAEHPHPLNILAPICRSARLTCLTLGIARKSQIARYPLNIDIRSIFSHAHATAPVKRAQQSKSTPDMYGTHADKVPPCPPPTGGGSPLIRSVKRATYGEGLFSRSRGG